MTVLGLMFKENVPDIRDSKVVDVVASLCSFDGADRRSFCDPGEALARADAMIFAVVHDAYVTGGWKLVQRCLKPNTRVVFDVKGILDRA